MFWAGGGKSPQHPYTQVACTEAGKPQTLHKLNPKAVQTGGLVAWSKNSWASWANDESQGRQHRGLLGLGLSCSLGLWAASTLLQRELLRLISEASVRTKVELLSWGTHVGGTS